MHTQPLPLRRSLFVAVIMVLIAGGLVGSVSRASAQPPGAHPQRPTVVLVHGAWADPSSWDSIVPRLRKDGYRTVTPTLALLSQSDDVATVSTVLDQLPGKKILVGHSYGGMIISAAAAGRQDVVGLVYAAAFVPEEGDSIGSLGAGFVPSEAFGHLAFLGTPFDSPAYIAPNLFGQYFAQDLSPTQAALLNAGQQPLNFSIVGTGSGPVGWHDVPSWYAVSGADRMIDPAQERWMARRAGSTTIEFSHAGHVGGITRHAAQFTALIERAARTTAR